MDMQRTTKSIEALIYAYPIPFVVLVFIAIGLIVFLGMLAIPIICIFLIALGIHEYNKPKTADLAQIVQQAAKHPFPPDKEFVEGTLLRFGEATDALPAVSILRGFSKVIRELYEAEDLVNPVPPLAPVGEIEEGRYRDRLIIRAKKLADAERTMTLLGNALGSFMLDFTSRLPPMAMDDPKASDDGLATVPLIEVVENVGAIVQSIYMTFAAPQLVEAGLFKDLREQLSLNLENATGRKSAPVWPVEAKLPPKEIVEKYLAHTPFLGLFDAQVAFSIGTHHRLEHTAIVAGSGWGKTQLLQWMILQDLERDDPPSLIVVDSTGQMVQRIQQLAVFSDKLRDRILIIDPAHSPALNMFDISTARLEKYTPEQREDVQSEVISLFNYIFASEDYDLSARMGTVFAYAVRLILSRRGSTIKDLRVLLEEKPSDRGYHHSAFRADIERLPEDAREFFSVHFFSAGFYGTRLNIAQRISKVLGVPAFQRMFTAATNALDLFSDMQRGSIILVNTNENLLKEQSYILFGRYVIARVLAAAFERATLRPEERKETYLIIDEAAPYFDKNFEALLTRVRQFRLGVVIAFQHLEQAPEKLKSAIASSTSVKFAGGLGFMDRRWLGREMETTPEFIGSLKKDGGERPRFTKFAAFVRNYTPRAISLTVPIGLLERQPKMDQATHEAMLRANLKRVAPAPPPVEEHPEAPSEDEPPSSVPVEVATAEEPSPRPPTTPKQDDDDLPTTWGSDKMT